MIPAVTRRVLPTWHQLIPRLAQSKKRNGRNSKQCCSPEYWTGRPISDIFWSMSQNNTSPERPSKSRNTVLPFTRFIGRSNLIPNRTQSCASRLTPCGKSWNTTIPPKVLIISSRFGFRPESMFFSSGVRNWCTHRHKNRSTGLQNHLDPPSPQTALTGEVLCIWVSSQQLSC